MCSLSVDRLCSGVVSILRAVYVCVRKSECVFVSVDVLRLLCLFF